MMIIIRLQMIELGWRENKHIILSYYLTCYSNFTITLQTCHIKLGTNKIRSNFKIDQQKQKIIKSIQAASKIINCRYTVWSCSDDTMDFSCNTQASFLRQLCHIAHTTTQHNYKVNIPFTLLTTMLNFFFFGWFSFF